MHMIVKTREERIRAAEMIRAKGYNRIQYSLSVDGDWIVEGLKDGQTSKVSKLRRFHYADGDDV